MGISNGDHPEIRDNDGQTVVYSATATTTPANVPSSDDKVISGIGVTNKGSIDLLISFDNGTTFASLSKKEFLAWDIKGNIKHLVVKTLSGTTDYEIIINFEDF